MICRAACDMNAVDIVLNKRTSVDFRERHQGSDHVTQNEVWINEVDWELE